MQHFKVGDLVYYNPTVENIYADGTKHLGVVIKVIESRPHFYGSFPEKDLFEYEYKIKWIESGHVSTLLGFNLKKLEIT